MKTIRLKSIALSNFY